MPQVTSSTRNNRQTEPSATARVSKGGKKTGKQRLRARSLPPRDPPFHTVFCPEFLVSRILVPEILVLEADNPSKRSFLPSVLTFLIASTLLQKRSSGCNRRSCSISGQVGDTYPEMEQSSSWLASSIILSSATQASTASASPLCIAS